MRALIDYMYNLSRRVRSLVVRMEIRVPGYK
jgi:hypothetical protein